jgi:hypothetical protein
MPGSRKSVEISRRNLLRSATVAAGGGAIFTVAMVTDTARAADKISQTAAAYQTIPKNGAQCDICALFMPPISCTLVEGNISTQGWCKYFTLRP